MADPVRTAGLHIDVYTIGQPGFAVITVANSGPATLTDEEAIRVLRAAAETVEQRGLGPRVETS